MKHLLVCSEQKPISLITHLASKFCSESGTVCDFCMGTGLTVEGYILATKQFKFFGSVADDSCHLELTLFNLKVFARHILSDDSNINESEGIQKVTLRHL